MVETLKTNTDLLETSNTAKEWTEKSPSSKLKDIQNLLNNPKNEKEQELFNLIEKREYKKFQKEIGAPQLDGKLGQQSYECFKAYENKEQKINNIVFKSEKKQKALNKEIFNSISIYNTGNQEILSSGNGKIEIKNRDINFGIQLTKIEGSIRINKNIESIKHFFLNRNNGILEIYEEQSKLPRFKLYPDGLIKGRSERNSNKYDIILQNDSGLLRATMLELNRDYDKYKNPIQKDIYNIGEKIKLNNKHIRFDGLSLYNAKTKQGEKIDCIKNFYINRTNDNRFEIFESGGTTPKLIINKEGVAKGSIPGNPNELNYGYTKDTTYYKLLRNELDNRYNKLNHKDPKIAEQNETDDKLFTNYLHLEPENLNKPKKEIDKNTPEILYKDFEICDRRNNGKSIKLTTGTLEFKGVLLSNGGPDTEIREPVKNMAIQKEGNNIYIYGNGNKYPRFILGQDGNVKGSIFNGDNECSYKAYNDKILRQDLWKELNEQYIAQNTTNNTVSLNGNSGVESDAKKTAAIKKEDTTEYNNIIPEGIKSGHIEEGEWYKEQDKYYGSYNDKSMFTFNMKQRTNKIGAGFSEINNNTKTYDIHSGYMIDFQQKKLYIINMGMHVNNTYGYGGNRQKIFDFNDIHIDNNSITIQDKDIVHTITKTGYKTDIEDLEVQKTTRSREPLYKMIIDNKENFS